jgi:hypothetical protein
MQLGKIGTLNKTWLLYNEEKEQLTSVDQNKLFIISILSSSHAYLKNIQTVEPQHY